jgi:multidrug resistance protein, MATE family
MTLRKELGPMMRLAAPLALTELGWMAMGIVDTIMAGRLNATAVGAGSLGNMLVYPIAVCGTGFLLGMDTLVSQAFGANHLRDCRRSLVNGVWLSVGITPLLIAVILAMIPAVRAAGTNPKVFAQFAPYLTALTCSVPPLLCGFALSRYLQALGVVRPILFAMISSNVLNALGDWALIFGHWGAPRMGLEGSAWSTTIARVYMMLLLAAAVLWHDRKSGRLLFRVSWLPDLERVRRLVALGLPAAAQILFEGAVFGLVTVWAARLDEASLAAHSIAVQVIATAFMVPLGISSAAAVRVGQAIGRKDPGGARTAGWTAVLISTIFMGSAALTMSIAPRFIVRLFIADPAVIAAGATLLRIAALFELFDGFQVVATGALRGLGDTRQPMIAHLIGYWAVGVPVAYVLCFPLHWGATGIWVGLTTALILIGTALVIVWWRRSAVSVET